MNRIKIALVDQNSHRTIENAASEFMRHNKLKNLAPYTLKYYQENLNFFQNCFPEIKMLKEITPETIQGYIGILMDKGDKVTAINARLRAIFVFLRYCFEKDWMESFEISQLKEDETLKEPYTDSELQKLLQIPKGTTWAEWRGWAVVNLLVATGVRANTVVNIKICDVDFEHGIIRLRKLKNRKQQIIPISTALNAAMTKYLEMWDWEPEYFLFPGVHNEQLQPHSLEISIRKYNLSRGVSKTSTHLFRHTFAKNYILAGGGMIQLQAILGHTTLDMTRKYVNLYGNDIQKDFDRLNPLNHLLANQQ